jgi:hypothetical protein
METTAVIRRHSEKPSSTRVGKFRSCIFQESALYSTLSERQNKVSEQVSSSFGCAFHDFNFGGGEAVTALPIHPHCSVPFRTQTGLI